MKRIRCVLSVLIIALMLTGCGGTYISLTPEESDTIAQYCAYLMLKYDANHTSDEKLMDRKDLEQALADLQQAVDEFKENFEEEEAEPEKEAETETEAEAGTAPETETESGKETDTEEPGQETGADEAETMAEDEDGGSTAQSSKAQADTEEQEPSTLSDIFDPVKFEVNYKDCRLADSYGENGTYFSFTATEGHKLLIAEFTITNITAGKLQFSASDYRPEYRLDISGRMTEPRITMILEDIQFIDSEIEPGKSIEAVLLFNVPEEGQDSYTLNIKGNADSGNSHETSIILTWR